MFKRACGFSFKGWQRADWILYRELPLVGSSLESYIEKEKSSAWVKSEGEYFRRTS